VGWCCTARRSGLETVRRVSICQGLCRGWKKGQSYWTLCGADGPGVQGQYQG